jgi:hypothetical protein
MSSISKIAKLARENKKDKTKKKKEKSLQSAEEESGMTIESATNTSSIKADKKSVRKEDDTIFESFNESLEKRNSEKESEEDVNSEKEKDRDPSTISHRSEVQLPSPYYVPGDEDDEEVREKYVKQRRAVFLEMALHHPTMSLENLSDFVDKRISQYSHVRTDSDSDSELDVDEKLTDTLIKLINLIDPSCSTDHHQSSTSGSDNNEGDDTEEEVYTHTSTTQTYHLPQRHSVDTNASTSTVLLAENDLPNKQFTHPITEAKLNRYVSAVQSLSNSSTNYRENREAFDNRIKHTLDLYWAISTNSIQALAKSWRELDLSGFRRFVLEHVSSAAASAASNKSVDLQVKTLIQKGIVFTATDYNRFVATIADIKIAWEEIPLATRNSKTGKDIQRELRKQIKEHFKVQVNGLHAPLATNSFWNDVIGKGCETFDQLLIAMTAVANQIRVGVSVAGLYQIPPTDNPKGSNGKRQEHVTDINSAHGNKKIKHTHNTSQPVTSQSAPRAPGTFKLDAEGNCYGCGNKHGSYPCRMHNLPHCNREDKPWRESTQGIFFKTKGYFNCPKSADPPPREIKKHPHFNKKGEDLLTLTNDDSNTFVKMTLLLPQGERTQVMALLDSGATSKNYVSERVASILRNRGVAVVASNAIVCTGLTDMCERCRGSMELSVVTNNEANQVLQLELQATIIESPFDLIIGRQSIKKLNLVKHFPSHFMDSEDIEEKMLGFAEGNPEKTLIYQARSEVARAKLVTERIHHLVTMLESANEQTTNAARRSAYERDDIEEIPLDKLEAIPTEMINEVEGDVQLPSMIFGPESLQQRLRETCEAYSECFSTEVRKEPARVPPYELRIDETKWEIPSNRLQPRRMDLTRQKELFRQITLLQDASILRVSSAAYYSHPLMVPKPNDKWRFCVDFTGLNKTTQWEKWPLPNIPEMLRRIGEKRPKYFIILDLTSGYHQIPISENSRRWTAFMTFWGIYRVAPNAHGSSRRSILLSKDNGYNRISWTCNDYL